MKMWQIIGIVVAALFVIAAVGGIGTYIWLGSKTSNAGDRTKLERTFTAEERRLIDEVKLTPEELAKFDGQQGQKAYVAVNGVVYDMSELGSWKRGKHHGVKAGADVTEKFVKSGHGRAKLQKMPVVGGLKTTETKEEK